MTINNNLTLLKGLIWRKVKLVSKINLNQYIIHNNSLLINFSNNNNNKIQPHLINNQCFNNKISHNKHQALKLSHL